MSTGEEYLDSIKAELEQGRRQWKLGGSPRLAGERLSRLANEVDGGHAEL